MKLVVGATGLLGGAITKKLLRKGENVRIMVRNNSPARAHVPHTDPRTLEAMGACITTGDITEPTSLRIAFKDVSHVIVTANTAKRGGDFETVDTLGTQALINAAETGGVKQFVYISALGADTTSSSGLFKAKGLSEEKLKISKLNYTILQPAAFMEDWIAYLLGAQLQRGPQLTLINGGCKSHGFVAQDNVADLAVQVLDHPKATRQAIPFSAGVASYHELIKMLEKHTGQPLKINSVVAGEGIPGLSEDMARIWARLEQGPEVKLLTPEIATTFNFPLVTIESFIQQSFSLT